MASLPEASPAGVLAMPKSGSPLASPNEHERAMLDFRDQAREEALAAQRVHPEAAKVHEYIDFLEGRHWPKGRRPWRSTLHSNRVAKARLDALSSLTDIKPTLDVIASSMHPDAEQQADIARNVIQAEWIRRGMMIDLIEVVDQAMLSTGYMKLGAVMPGKLLASACGFDNVLPIQPTSRLQEASGVLYRTHRPLSYFFQRWAHHAEALKEHSVRWPNRLTADAFQKPRGLDEVTWKYAAPQFKHHLGMRQADPTAGKTYFPIVPLEEYWIEDYTTADGERIVKDPDLGLWSHNYHYKVRRGERLFPGKRLIVFGGDKLLYDGPNVYWHGLYPFAQLNLNPVVWAPGSLSRYRDLIPLNKAINEIIAGVHELIRRAVNPQMVAREGSVHMADWLNFWQDKAGEKLLMAPRSDIRNDIQWVNPPQLPSYVYMMLLQYLVPEFEKISGFLDVASLGRKQQVPGGDTIEQMRDSLQTQLKLESRYIEQFLVDAGELALSNVFQFFTGRQRMKIMGPDGLTMQDYDYDPGSMVPWSLPKQEHWKLFGLQVAEGSLHGASKDREKQMAVSLYKGRVISRKELLRRLSWGNIDQIEKELSEEMEQAAQAGSAAGDIKGMPRGTRGQRQGDAV